MEPPLVFPNVIDMSSSLFSGPDVFDCGTQAAISRLNTMAAIIGVQDSLQHVGPQLWFLQFLLGKLTLIVHSFAARSLRLCSKQGLSSMQHYLAADPSYCCTTVVQPGTHGMTQHLVQGRQATATSLLLAQDT